MRIARILLLVFFLSSFVASNVLAQYPWAVTWDPQALAQFLFPGMNSEWLRIPDVLYYVILPFIASFAVVYGLLRELRIFRMNVPNKVNIILAFCMTFMLLPSGILTWVITILYAGSAFIGIVAFGILFIAGVILWFYGTTIRLWNEYNPKEDVDIIRDYNRRYGDLQKRLFQIQEEKLHHPGRAMMYVDEETKIRNQMADILGHVQQRTAALKAQTQ
jgi:hypothetical protein